MDTGDRHILSVTCFGHFLSHFNMLVFPALVLPLAGRLQMDVASVLDLGFWMYLLFGITALGWGYLADRIGPRPLLALFYLGAGICGIGCSMVIDMPVMLRWWLAGIGLFSAIYHPAGLGWIACCVSRTSVGMAYNGMFGNLGLASAPLAAGLINWVFGIRAVYLGLGILNLLGLLLLWQTRGQAPARRRPGHAAANAAASARSFALLLVCMMLAGIVYRGSTVTLPTLFELRGADLYAAVTRLVAGGLPANVVATVITSGLYLVGMVGQYLGGRVGERFDLRWGYLVFHGLTVPAAMLAGVLTDLPLVLVATLHSMFLLGMQPIENTLVARLTLPSMHSFAYGMKFVLTFGVGSLAVKLVRWLTATQGIETVFPVLGMISLLLLGAISLLMRVTPPLHS